MRIIGFGASNSPFVILLLPNKPPRPRLRVAGAEKERGLKRKRERERERAKRIKTEDGEGVFLLFEDPMFVFFYISSFVFGFR